uniref:Uncharacterized protein n=1 Tax=Anguilla anguilla TaxID=7936 RepID=A0A0E9UF74_ANGAN
MATEIPGGFTKTKPRSRLFYKYKLIFYTRHFTACC